MDVVGPIAFFAAIWVILFGGFGRGLGAMNGRPGEGRWLGILLGPIGCLIAVLMPPSDEELVRRERIRERARREAGLPTPPARQAPHESVR